MSEYTYLNSHTNPPPDPVQRLVTTCLKTRLNACWNGFKPYPYKTWFLKFHTRAALDPRLICMTHARRCEGIDNKCQPPHGWPRSPRPRVAVTLLPRQHVATSRVPCLSSDLPSLFGSLSSSLALHP